MIGEELIKVKQNKEAVPHGQFKPWVKENCSFSYQSAHAYMTVAKAKIQRSGLFKRCQSINEVLDLGKPKPTPSGSDKQELRAATLNDLRKVERLRALSEGQLA